MKKFSPMRLTKTRSLSRARSSGTASDGGGTLLSIGTSSAAEMSDADTEEAVRVVDRVTSVTVSAELVEQVQADGRAATKEPESPPKEVAANSQQPGTSPRGVADVPVPASSPQPSSSSQVAVAAQMQKVAQELFAQTKQSLAKNIRGGEKADDDEDDSSVLFTDDEDCSASSYSRSMDSRSAYSRHSEYSRTDGEDDGDDDDGRSQEEDDDGADDDDESADSYVNGADLVSAAALYQNVLGAFQADDANTVGGDTLTDYDEDTDAVDDDDNADADAAASQGKDDKQYKKKFYKICHQLAANDYKLTEIDVDCTRLTREMAKEMADLLPSSSRVERIRLAASQSDPATRSNFRLLVAGIGRNGSLRDVQIRDAHLTREAACQLGRALASGTAAVPKLCFRHCRFDASALPVLFVHLPHARTKLQELYVLQCDLSDPVHADVVSASVPLLGLRSLCLIDTQLTVGGLRFLAEHVERTPTLTQINLSLNRGVAASAEAVRLIARLLASDVLVNLTSVSLASCALDPDAVRELARAVVDNATLTTLDLSGNRFGDEGARHLRYLLDRNHTLKELGVRGCDITKRRRKAIDDGLKYNNSMLKSLFSKETSLSIFSAVEQIEEFGNSVTGR